MTAFKRYARLLILVSAVTAVAIDAAADCDLSVSLVSPLQSELAPGASIEWKLRFSNAGDSRCSGNTVMLNRVDAQGKQSTTVGGSAGRKRLSALAAGQIQELNFREHRSPTGGKHTYQLEFGKEQRDANNRNHVMKRLVSFSAGGSSASGKTSSTSDATAEARKRNDANARVPEEQRLPEQARAREQKEQARRQQEGDRQGTESPTSGKKPEIGECDLRAQLVRPKAEEIDGGAQHKWEILFRNEGNGRCDANQVYLVRTELGTARLTAPAVVGNDRERKTLPALARGGELLIAFVEDDTPVKGDWKYELAFATRHSDANNKNHRILKTLRLKGRQGEDPPPGGGSGGEAGSAPVYTGQVVFQEGAPDIRFLFGMSTSPGVGKCWDLDLQLAPGRNAQANINLFLLLNPTILQKVGHFGIHDPRRLTQGAAHPFAGGMSPVRVNADGIVSYADGSPLGDSGKNVFCVYPRDNAEAGTYTTNYSISDSDAAAYSGFSNNTTGTVSFQIVGGIVPTGRDLSTWRALRPAFQSPRCANCHAIVENNALFVALAEASGGQHNNVLLEEMNPEPCSGCHNADLIPEELPQVTHPNLQWQAPPASMGFAGVPEHLLCEKARNTGTTASDTADHLKGDPLILWAIQGGQLPNGTTLEPVAGGIQTWNAAVDAWIAAARPCPLPP